MNNKKKKTANKERKAFGRKANVNSVSAFYTDDKYEHEVQIIRQQILPFKIQFILVRYILSCNISGVNRLAPLTEVKQVVNNVSC